LNGIKGEKQMKAFGAGNLTKDPELKTTSGGISVCTFTVAENVRRGKEKKAEYTDCVAWRELGENVAKYMSKGKKVFVIGDLQTRSYETKNGEKRYVTEVICEKVDFLSPMGEKKDAEAGREPQDFEPLDDSEMPF